MPEIDTELFQQIALGLLVLLLLVSLLILSALGKIRKAIEQAGSGAPAPFEESQPEPEAQPQTAAAPAASESYSQPWGEAATQQQPAATQPEAAAPAAIDTASMPEEQPFEREGRWWFKRGDELLVYDEQTGQWTPAPAGSPSSTSPAGAATTEFGEVASGEGGFWKCPSCGAVNGSTSATCRMCFSPRPA